MTCVLPTSSFHHFNDHLPWLPMNPDMASSQPSLEKSHSSGYSPGSDTRKSSTSSGKKRASRAGTRSVTTLSAAQLERKRANDREAQRAIRQRTKDHIDHLERTVNELRGSQEQSEKIVHATQQRNRELEDENAYLRNKLNETGINLSFLPDGQRPSETALLSVPSTSPATAAGPTIPRPGSTSTPSNHSVTTQGSGSRHGSWQHGAGFVGTAMGLPSAATVASAPGLTAWRSHDSSQSIQSGAGGMQDPMQSQQPASYPPGERVDWSGNPAPYQYVSQEQQRPQQYETAPAQQQQGYQNSSYHTQMTPQNDFPNIAVSSSPSTYSVQSQPAFPQAAPFQVTPMQVPTSATEYTSPHGQMQPPPLPNPSFQTSPTEQSYGTQHAAPSMQYRDESANRSYSLTHYPTA